MEGERDRKGCVLVFLLALLIVTELVVVHQVSERLWGDGHHVGQDDPAVAAAGEQQLIVRVIVPHTPHPETHSTASHTPTTPGLISLFSSSVYISPGHGSEKDPSLHSQGLCEDNSAVSSKIWLSQDFSLTNLSPIPKYSLIPPSPRLRRTPVAANKKWESCAGLCCRGSFLSK